MKRAIVGLVIAAGVATASAAAAGFVLLPPAAPAGQFTLYGHIKKLSKTGGKYVLRFDPAMFTTGLTASVAAKEDTGSSDVPNDVYTVEESHRLYSYYLAPNAKVTVLTNHGTSGISATPHHRRRALPDRERRPAPEAVRAARLGRLDPRPDRHGQGARPAVPSLVRRGAGLGPAPRTRLRRDL